MFKLLKQGWGWVKCKVQSGWQWLRSRWAGSRPAVTPSVERPRLALARVAAALTLLFVVTSQVLAQTSGGPVDTSALTTGLTTVTTIFNTVAGIVAAAVLFFVGVKVFKWIRK